MIKEIESLKVEMSGACQRLQLVQQAIRCLEPWIEDLYSRITTERAGQDLCVKMTDRDGKTVFQITVPLVGNQNVFHFFSYSDTGVLQTPCLGLDELSQRLIWSVADLKEVKERRLR